MVCISELRGLQNFQARHPETVVVAMNALEDEHAQDAIERLIKKQKLDMLRNQQTIPLPVGDRSHVWYSPKMASGSNSGV